MLGGILIACLLASGYRNVEVVLLLGLNEDVQAPFVEGRGVAVGGGHEEAGLISNRGVACGGGQGDGGGAERGGVCDFGVANRCG
jgi:hypothetical protein